MTRTEREALALRAFGLDRAAMRTESVTSRATCDADVVTEDTRNPAEPGAEGVGTPGATS